MRRSALRVLLVEDDPIDARLFRDMLSGPGGKSWTIEWVRSIADAIAKLDAGGFDVALVDLALPDSCGKQTLDRIIAHAPRIPIVVLTDVDEDHVGAVAVREGAQDYLPKGEITGSLLQRSVRYAVERHQAERALRAAHEEHRSMIEASPLAIISVNRAGEVTSWSPAAESILGWSAREAVGRPNPIHPVDDDQGDHLWRMLSCERFIGAELQVRTRDGSIIDVSLSSAPFGTGDESGAVITVEDITTRRQIEEQLQQARKLEAVGQLAGGVAHDFNNLLACIMGYTELLARRIGEDEQLHRYSATIQEACQRAADLTGQLLAFSRRGKTRTEHVAMHEVICRVADVLAPALDGRIRVAMDLAAPSCTVWGDPTQLGNAVLNLATNARDAMPEGGDLTFATRIEFLADEGGTLGLHRLPPDDYLEVSVSDTGVGIPESLLDRIFEPFFTTKEVGKGAGLGLSALYGIVRDHGGSLRVRSREGSGTVFLIYLPLCSDSPLPPGAEGRRDAAPGTGLVLVADDEEMVRSLVTEILEEEGLHVLTAANGRQAVEIYRERHEEIALVVLDMVMPEMSGREAFLAMREINPDVKALISSGYSLDLCSDMLAEPGIVGTVPKPFRWDALCEAVMKAVEHGGAAPPFCGGPAH